MGRSSGNVLCADGWIFPQRMFRLVLLWDQHLMTDAQLLSAEKVRNAFESSFNDVLTMFHSHKGP